MMPNSLTLDGKYENEHYFAQIKLTNNKHSIVDSGLSAIDSTIENFQKINLNVNDIKQPSQNQTERKTSNGFTVKSTKTLPLNYDNGYDSTGQKQTDESLSDEDDDLDHHDSNDSNQNIKVSIHRLRSCPVDIIKRTNSLRGILKYPPGWQRRGCHSESDSSMQMMMYQHQDSQQSEDYGYFGTSNESPGIFSDCFEYDQMIDDDCSEYDPNKPKKCVTFSDKMATYVFRPGSSILGRKQKNQKKAKKKKEREMKKYSCSPEEVCEKDRNLPPHSVVTDDCHRLNHVDDNEIEAIKNALNLRRFGGNINNTIFLVDDGSYSGSTSGEESSVCSDTSASDCSSADESTNNQCDELTQLNSYEEETIQGKFNHGNSIENKGNHNDNNFDVCNTKAKRKNRRRRNRKNKLTVRTYLETGGYDSD